MSNLIAPDELINVEELINVRRIDQLTDQSSYSTKVLMIPQPSSHPFRQAVGTMPSTKRRSRKSIIYIGSIFQTVIRVKRERHNTKIYSSSSGLRGLLRAALC